MSYTPDPKYGIQPAKIISEDRFWEMLEVLPPCKWNRGDRFEFFHVSERLSGDIVSWFVRVGPKTQGSTFYELQDHDYLTKLDLVERIDAARTAAGAHQHYA